MAIKEIKQLEKLDFKKQLAFAYLSSKRAYPNYKYFSITFNFGNYQILEDAIDFLYKNILSLSVNNKSLDKLLQDIDTNAPRPEDFSSYYASIGMYSAGVIYESINLLKQTDISRILNDISTMSTDAIDTFIQEQNNIAYDDNEFEEKILSNPIMQQELAIQKGIIKYLVQTDDIAYADIETLLQLQLNGTGSLIL